MEGFSEYEPPTTEISFDDNNEYHVFLSFRGPDVRTKFVDHLYESLSAAGLRVFLDSEELEKGKDIDSSLQNAIEKSDILIPIFSEHYAESTWCLEEAARMCRSNGVIIPLFYDVEPCDARYPRRKGGKFAEGFRKHYNHLDRQDESTIQSWEDALHRISHLSGWTLEAESRCTGLGSLLEKKINIYLCCPPISEEEREPVDRLYESLQTTSRRRGRGSAEHRSKDDQIVVKKIGCKAVTWMTPSEYQSKYRRKDIKIVYKVVRCMTPSEYQSKYQSKDIKAIFTRDIVVEVYPKTKESLNPWKAGDRLYFRPWVDDSVGAADRIDGVTTIHFIHDGAPKPIRHSHNPCWAYNGYKDCHTELKIS